MHSSRMRRMRTSRLLISYPIVSGGGGVCPGVVSVRDGGLPRGGVTQHAMGQTPPCGQNS